MAGNLFPEVPTMLSLPTFPLRRRSNNVSPTTPTFLSEPDIPPPTKPVVYSPVPTCHALVNQKTRRGRRGTVLPSTH